MFKSIVGYWFKGILAIGITVLVFLLGGVVIDLFDTSVIFRYFAIVCLVSLVAIVIGMVIELAKTKDDDDEALSGSR